MQKYHAILGQSHKAGFFTSLALAIGAGVAAGAGISKLISPKKSSSTPTVLQQKQPAAPAVKTVEQIQTQSKNTATAQAIEKRKRRTKTVLTGPRGLLTEPKTEQKALAGTLG